jgi:N,N'-diacetyllegionaminate synthase
MNKLEIIAEIGVNHNGDVKLAKKLIDRASMAGADYIKIQSYITEKLVSKNTRLARYQEDKKVKNQYQLLEKYELSFSDQLALLNYSRKKKIKFLSSPFDIDSCKYLKKMKLNVVKIASGEITNYPLLKYVSKNFNKVFLSTGMANLKEIKNALKILKKNKKKTIILLHCTSEYPANVKNVNLNLIKKLKFANGVGFSDHTIGMSAAIMSIAYGVCLIEKHITLNKSLPGPDHKASMNIKDFFIFVKKLREAVIMTGKSKFIRSKAEKSNSKVIRKSIFAKDNIMRGDILSEKNLCTKRPGTYMPSSEWFNIMGKKLNINLKINKPLLKKYLK